MKLASSVFGSDALKEKPTKPNQTKPPSEHFSISRTSLTGSARPSSFKPVEAHGYYRAWVRPLPPRAASRLSGLVRRLRCFVPKQRHAQCRADLGQGPGHTLKKMSIKPITNHQSIRTTQTNQKVLIYSALHAPLPRSQAKKHFAPAPAYREML